MINILAFDPYFTPSAGFGQGGGGGPAGDEWIGTITPPITGKNYNEGLVPFINNGFRLLFIVFAAFALVNFVLASYDFISAGGDAKKIDTAKNRLVQTIVGLILLMCTFLFAGLVGQVFFGNWGYILNIDQTLNTLIVTPAP